MQRLKDYYADKVILLTGGTGLVGKVLIEKVLRQLPQIRRVYILTRPKSKAGGISIPVQERLRQEIRDATAFDLLRLEHGTNFHQFFDDKVIAIEGDVAQDNLGLDEEAYRRLQKDVDIIINCAALVTFDAPIDAALALNTLGSKRILAFAKGCREAVVAHVSTCYVNATRQGSISEEPLDPKTSIAQIKGISDKPYDVDEEISDIEKQIDHIRGKAYKRLSQAQGDRDGWDINGRHPEGQIKRTTVERTDRRLSSMGMKWAQSRGWHDVYTFTKAMGEQVFVRNQESIRAAIIRPAIIESALESPLPGWLNGLRMLDPLILAYGKGRLIDFPGNAKGILDIIPVDVVVNALLAIVPNIYQREELQVYHIASGMENPLTLQGFADLVEGYFRRYPFISRSGVDGSNRSLRPPTFPSTRKFLRRLRWRYMIPARMLGLTATASSFHPAGRRLRSEYKTKLSGLERLAQYGRLYGPYAESHSKFLTNHTKQLWESLSSEDQKEFNFDISKLNWRSYIQDIHIPGIKRYVLGMIEETTSSTIERDRVLSRVAIGDSKEEGTRKAEQAAISTLAIEAGSDEGSSVSLHHALSTPHWPEALTPRTPDSKEIEQWTRKSLTANIIRGSSWIPMKLAYQFWVSVKKHGVENVPFEGPFIIASNHCSHMDTPAIFHALGEKARDLYTAAAVDYFFEGHRYLGRYVHAVFRAVPFDRQGHVTEGLGLALAILNRGHPLVFYPEGGRSETGVIQPFKAGIGVLALLSHTPIIPTHLQGTFDSMPKGNWFPKRQEVVVSFGQPISVEPYLSRLDSKGIGEACRSLTVDLQKAVEALNGRG